MVFLWHANRPHTTQSPVSHSLETLMTMGLCISSQIISHNTWGEIPWLIHICGAKSYRYPGERNTANIWWRGNIPPGKIRSAVLNCGAIRKIIFEANHLLTVLCSWLIISWIFFFVFNSTLRVHYRLYSHHNKLFIIISISLPSWVAVCFKKFLVLFW